MSKFFGAFSREMSKAAPFNMFSTFFFFFFSHALCVRCLNMSPNEIICWLAFPLAAKIKGTKKK